jgi:hypothetical protein
VKIHCCLLSKYTKSIKNNRKNGEGSPKLAYISSLTILNVKVEGIEQDLIFSEYRDFIDHSKDLTLSSVHSPSPQGLCPEESTVLCLR